MKETLKKWKLIADFTVEINNIEKSDFVKKFREQVDEGGIGIFDGMFDPFKSSKNDYRGTVSLNSFKIKRRRKFFDRNKMMVVASGSYQQRIDKLIISTEVNGLNKLMIPVFILISIFYILFICAFTFSGANDNSAIPFLPFIFIHAAFMLGIPFFMIRKSVQNMVRDLEKDFRLISIS